MVAGVDAGYACAFRYYGVIVAVCMKLLLSLGCVVGVDDDGGIVDVVVVIGVVVFVIGVAVGCFVVDVVVDIEGVVVVFIVVVVVYVVFVVFVVGVDGVAVVAVVFADVVVVAIVDVVFDVVGGHDGNAGDIVVGVGDGAAVVGGDVGSVVVGVMVTDDVADGVVVL